MLVLLITLLVPLVSHPNRLIVRTSSGKSPIAIKYLKEHYKLSGVRHLFPLTNKTHRNLYNKYRLGDYLVVEFDTINAKYDLSTLQKELLANELFETAEMDFRIIPMYMPDDPSLPLQWGLFKIAAPAAWDISKGSKDVKIVVDDTGVDWKHDDLLDNLWQNLGEDADGDGHVIELVNGEWQFDPGDVNGVDDDGNGLVDDFIGWNFEDGNNNPEPDPSQDGYYHGTHVGGICSATTDNALGISSVAFSAVIVPSRSSWISNSTSALQWAADMGFDVFNMSWGLYSDLSYLESAINYAYDAGVLLVAAAGNEETSDSLFPAAYDKVIAVAATNRDDEHAYYTNYGDYVEIAAPGGDAYVDPMIYSTMPDSAYDYLQGTSMASPMLASVAALVKAANPFLSNDGIRSILASTADSIDDNLFNQGLLGAGRVNAYKAVREAARQLRAFVIVDSIEVSPNRPVRGDTVEFTITILDSAGWQDAIGLTVYFSSDNPDFILLDSVASVGNLSAGATTTITFKGYVPLDFEPANVRFVISYSSTGYLVERRDEFSKIIGHPYVIVVDDANNNGAYLDYYTNSLDSLGLVYDVWDVAASGIPPISGDWGLKSYRTVVWFTGDETDPLTDEEIDSLKVAIDSGVNLFISSQNLGESLGTSPFMTDYLGAGFDQPSASDVFVKGVANDPIGDSISLAVAGAGGAQNGNSMDIIHAEGNGIVFLNYGLNGTGGGAGVRMERGAAKVVFIAFPFEAINGQVTGQNTKAEFMHKILTWMEVTSVLEQPSVEIFAKDVLLARSGNRPINLLTLYKDAKEFVLYSVSGRKVSGIENGMLYPNKIPAGLYIIRIPNLRKNIKFLKLK